MPAPFLPLPIPIRLGLELADAVQQFAETGEVPSCPDISPTFCGIGNTAQRGSELIIRANRGAVRALGERASRLWNDARRVSEGLWRGASPQICPNEPRSWMDIALDVSLLTLTGIPSQFLLTALPFEVFANRMCFPDHEKAATNANRALSQVEYVRFQRLRQAPILSTMPPQEEVLECR